MQNATNGHQDTATLAALPFHGNLGRVVLTGFMGAGKSTVGRLLADRVGWNFLDVDCCIEASTGRSAKELFNALGEQGFRQLESDVLASSLLKSRTIIALGGAAIDMTANQNLLATRPRTLVVFLDAPFTTLMERCREQERTGSATYRPLLHKSDVALARFSARKSLYAAHAHVTVAVAEKSPAEVVQTILLAMGVFGKHGKSSLSNLTNGAPDHGFER
ncbi:MAG TPA: shikimate kinase [Terracidiphilus sp.]|jgi:shikimate kinase